ncbi:hypothetical protein CMI37_38695 [Candidatus Pacearchaeota archaeon]|jgi:parallel beta-helix repeat protein|nr:hypothetical protein [Candidatus Pacearchaeota archaeon]|tara:strand:+ start:180 stop:1136 length:957 start_codon:yes stop_codon:yes gene_type:complete
MVLGNFPHFDFITPFQKAAADGDSPIARGGGTRQGTIRVAKSDEFIVAADGTGDFLTIAEALTKLGSSSGTIRVKAGNYLITENISLGANQSIIGSGYGTRIHTTSNIDLITLSGNRSAIFMCRIDGNSTGTSQNGIVADGTECIIKDCWITQMGGDGIQSEGDRTIIHGTRVEDCGVQCIHINVSDGGSIVGCNIDNASDSGILMVSGDQWTIVGNQIVNHGEDGIEMVSSSFNQVTGNYIFSNGDNNTDGNGVHLSGEANHENVMTGNVISTNDGHGVEIDANSSNNVIVGNSIRNNEDGSVDDNGTATVNANNAT